MGSSYVWAEEAGCGRTVEFTQPVLAPTYIYDPWWGMWGRFTSAPTKVLGSITNNTGAWDVGGGFNIPLPRSGFKLYIQARYYTGFTHNTHTTLVPVTVGLRW